MYSPKLYLIDTHTHFDDPRFDIDRLPQAKLAYQSGIQHLLMTGYLATHFERLLRVQQHINQHDNTLTAHVALGLHPDFILEHNITEHSTVGKNKLTTDTPNDIDQLENLLQTHAHNNPSNDTHKSGNHQKKTNIIIAIGEIGLDSYRDCMKQPHILQQQQALFCQQLDLAHQYQLPILLHIRKAHAQCLKLLKQHAYNAHNLGGIAHSFSGGEQEAKAFVKMGFKLGITGQICNQNAKKLHRAIKSVVAEYGLSCLVIETDCPDMTPITHQQNIQIAVKTNTQAHIRNTPVNLLLVLKTLSQIFAIDSHTLAQQLWHNSREALRMNWDYPFAIVDSN